MSSVGLKRVLDFFLGEISEFGTQFARLTRIDIQFVSISGFDIVVGNCFSLGVSLHFSAISLHLFFLFTSPHERTFAPLSYPFSEILEFDTQEPFEKYFRKVIWMGTAENCIILHIIMMNCNLHARRNVAAVIWLFFIQKL